MKVKIMVSVEEEEDMAVIVIIIINTIMEQDLISSRIKI